MKSSPDQKGVQVDNMLPPLILSFLTFPTQISV